MWKQKVQKQATRAIFLANYILQNQSTEKETPANENSSVVENSNE